MNAVVLDTNIVSFILKKNSRAKIYSPHFLGRRVVIAIMTVAELFQWSTTRKWGRRRINEMEAELARYTILPEDIDTCRIWATIRATRTSHGEPIAAQDAWIAATAVQHNLPLITHNPRDYRSIDGLVVITELTE